MEPLTNPQKRRLKALAQKLDATLHVGKAGLTGTFLAALNFELDRHELVKVKFAGHKDAKHDLAPQLAEKSASHLVWLIGHVAVLYRQQPDPAKRKVEF